MYDVLIIGAGVVGGVLARELKRYDLSVCLLEKESDVATGATKANSGIIHGGFDPEPDTLKAKLNAQGVELLYEAAKELNVPYKNNGSMVVAFSKEEELVLEELLNRGKQNGIDGLSIISGDKAREIEPNLSDEITKVLLVPSAGIISPYDLTVAAIGNAMDNGAELLRDFEVKSIEKSEFFTVKSENGEEVSGKYVINCAGCFADKIAEKINDKFYEIIPRSGEYMLLDKLSGSLVSHTIFGVPSKEGKGILVTPTAHGNLLLGPTATVVLTPDNNETTKDGLGVVERLAKKNVPSVNTRTVITSFCGVRASTKGGDFIIEESKKEKGFFHVAGIDSPGLTSCVAIAKYVTDLLKESGLELKENKKFNGFREDTRKFEKMTDSEKDEFIKKNPEYGRIICRCESISEGEMLDALRRNPKATDVDGIKRRTRAGMGRCQGGFCSPYVMSLIAKENGFDLTFVTKKGKNSKLVTGKL